MACTLHTNNDSVPGIVLDLRHDKTDIVEKNTDKHQKNSTAEILFLLIDSRDKFVSKKL